MFHLILDMPPIEQAQGEYASLGDCASDGRLLVAELTSDAHPPSFRCVYYPSKDSLTNRQEASHAK